jgi:hypothetical protein
VPNTTIPNDDPEASTRASKAPANPRTQPAEVRQCPHESLVRARRPHWRGCDTGVMQMIGIPGYRVVKLDLCPTMPP